MTLLEKIRYGRIQISAIKAILASPKYTVAQKIVCLASYMATCIRLKRKVGDVINWIKTAAVNRAVAIAYRIERGM